MRRSLCYYATPLLLAAAPAQAQERDGLDLSADIRLRYETISGQARANVPASESELNWRLTANARWRSGPLELGATIIDSRVIDMRTRSALGANEVDALEPIEAYAAYRFRGGRVQVGRFTLDLASRRLIARDDYRNTATGFTGIRLDLTPDARTSATLLYVLPQQHLPGDPDGIRHARVVLDREGFDQRLWGGNVARRIGGGISADATFYRFEERDIATQATRDRRLNTFGARIIRPAAPGRWDFEVEGFRQTGSIAANLSPSAPRIAVSAGFAHSRIGYQWRGGWKPRVSVEMDYASGDGAGSSYGRFDTLFGMRRGEIGPAGLYNATTRTNLISPGVRLEVTPSKRSDAFVTARKMWLASRYDQFATTGVIDPTGRSGRDAGWQVDGRVRWWAVPKRLQLEADAVWLAKGRFLRTAPNRSSGADTAYLSLNASLFL